MNNQSVRELRWNRISEKESCAFSYYVAIQKAIAFAQLTQYSDKQVKVTFYDKSFQSFTFRTQKVACAYVETSYALYCSRLTAVNDAIKSVQTFKRSESVRVFVRKHNPNKVDPTEKLIVSLLTAYNSLKNEMSWQEQHEIYLANNVPISLGGNASIANITTACATCNYKKSSELIDPTLFIP